MLDIKFIREHRELVAEAARKKRLKFEVRELLILDEKRLKLLAEVEQMRAEQNRVSEEIAGASETRRRSVLIASMRTLKGALQDREMKLAGVIKDWQKLMLEVPNLPDIAVPEGESDADNQELRRVGEPPSFDFAPRSHLDLMTTLGMVDFERGVKVAGFRGYILKDAGAILSFALWRFVLDQFAPLGFTPPFAFEKGALFRHQLLAARRGRFVSDSRSGLLGRHRRSGDDGLLAGRDFIAGPIAAKVSRLLALLPPRGRQSRQGHQRFDSRPRVFQTGTSGDLRSQSRDERQVA